MVHSDMDDSETVVPILDVRFFRYDNGTEPVREWLRSIPKEHRRAIGVDIKTVQFSWPIGMPAVGNLKNGIWEVRTRLDDSIARVLFATDTGIMILLHGFIKKTRRTPDDDLEIARKRLSDYKRGKK